MSLETPWGIPLLLLIANALFPVAVIEESERIAAGGAQSAAVAIEMPSGMLEVGSSDASLLDAAFRYGEAQPQPQVQYDFANGHGTLRVKQAPQDTFTFRPAPNEWRLQLNRDILLNLNVEIQGRALPSTARSTLRRPASGQNARASYRPSFALNGAFNAPFLLSPLPIPPVEYGPARPALRYHSP